MTVDIDRLTVSLPAAQAREIRRAYRSQAKDETAAYLWCFFLGSLGAHRLYLRQWTRALLHIQVLVVAALVIIAGILLHLQPLLVTVIVAPFILGALIWSWIDLASIDEEVSDRNLHLAERLVAPAMLADPTRERHAEEMLEAAERQQAQTAASAAPVAIDAAAFAPAAADVAPAESYTPERETPPHMDIGVAAATGIAALGIAGGYRAVAEPAPEPAAPEPAATPAYAPTWDASTNPDTLPAVPAWDTPTPPPSYYSEPVTEPSYSTPTGDVTDLGGDLGPVPPVADLESGTPWQLTPDAMPAPSSTAASAGGDGLLVFMPEAQPAPYAEPAPYAAAEEPAPPIWPTAPEWPAADEAPQWAAPTNPYADPYADAYSIAPEPAAPAPVEPAASSAQTGSDSAGGITPELLAAAAGLAGAGGIGAMNLHSDTAQTPPTPEPTYSAPAQEPAPSTSPLLLKHIRVVRQVKVGDDVVSESVAEAYIDPSEDPEPVRERLREQLRREAEAAQDNQPDQSNG